MKIELLNSQNPNIALSAIEDNKQIGLLLATLAKGIPTAEVHSLHVGEEHRKKGIGTALMIALDQHLKENGCIVATMLYETNSINCLALEHILKKCRWDTPKPYINRYLYDGATFNPPWITKNYRFPENFVMFPWKDLSVKDKLELKRREEQWNFPIFVSPFHNVEQIEFKNSFGLKLDDRIIGWIINHRFNETTIRYSSLYIEPEYQYRGVSILLLIHAMKTQKELIAKGDPAITALFDLNLEQTENIWQHFIERRLAPYADEKITINRAVKVFKT